MEWTEALEIVVARTGHERYRVLCADDHPDREAHRRRVIEGATGGPGHATPDAFPSLARQAANLAGAVGRVVGAAATGGPIMVPPPVYYERLAICRGCEHNADAPAGVHCKLCGCGGAKLQLATEACPLDPPKWPRWTEEPNHADHDH